MVGNFACPLLCVATFRHLSQYRNRSPKLTLARITMPFNKLRIKFYPIQLCKAKGIDKDKIPFARNGTIRQLSNLKSKPKSSLFLTKNANAQIKVKMHENA